MEGVLKNICDIVEQDYRVQTNLVEKLIALGVTGVSNLCDVQLGRYVAKRSFANSSSYAYQIIGLKESVLRQKTKSVLSLLLLPQMLTVVQPGQHQYCQLPQQLDQVLRQLHLLHHLHYLLC
jgi:hypothetical protein